jgi:putative ABC transport system ATP-binding protein
MSDAELSTSDIYLRPQVTFQSGKIYLVNAQSGRGKSSLLNFIYQCSKQFTGTIDFIDKKETKTTTQLRRSYLSYVFQDLKLFPQLSVWDNIQLKNKLTQFKSSQQIQDMLKHADLHHKINQSVATLSIGQQQRVAIIRALCQPFHFLLLDEPFSHLDEHNSRLMSALISQEVQQQKAGLIVTSLDPINHFHYHHQFNL